MIKNTARHSDKIITGSHNSKNDIINHYNIQADKIEVIPYGISPRFSPEKDAKIAQKALNKFQIKRPNVLTVGRLNPRKNLITLIKAFSSAKNTGTIPHKLVIAGRKDYRTHDITNFIRKNSLNEHIIFPGFIPDKELPYIYNQADLFVYPSLYEGVGLPVLEAMKSGVPVITSNNSSLLEIIADAGITVPPLDSEQIARALINLLNNPELRSKYRHKGLERANKLNWEETASHTLAVYEEVYKSE
jgi:glycosyltransferase involved in cell wall biosynthesis